MTREELIGTNANIVRTVTENILKHSPNTIIIVVSNPMDTMNYLTLQTSGLPKNRVLGMGGALDSARFKYYLSQELACSPSDLNAIVIGGHGDTTMIPLINHATWNSIPVTQLLSKEQQDKIVSATMVGGATLTKLIGTSAWYAPGAGTCAMVESIVRDEKKLISCGVALDGEYGQKDISLVVPVILGKNGWERILNFQLSTEEQVAFNKSADAVRSMNDVLKTL
jgi:malate dehydrogenase